MRLIGFNFVKINAEKLKDRPNSIKFNTKIDISSIDILKSDVLKTKEQCYSITKYKEVVKQKNITKC